MKLHVVRTGGGPDLRRQIDIDTSELSREVAGRIVTVIDRIDLVALEGSSRPLDRADDGFQYEVTVSRVDRAYHFVVHGRGLGEDLRELFDLLFVGL